jgi:hypothetical protein
MVWIQEEKRKKMEAHILFLQLFTVCSSCKQKFVVYLLVDKETYGSYLFANGLYGLAHLWVYII